MSFDNDDFEQEFSLEASSKTLRDRVRKRMYGEGPAIDPDDPADSRDGKHPWSTDERIFAARLEELR